jgi:integrase/recombinase XerD
MPATLSTTIGNIKNIQNKVNADLVREFYEYMLYNGSSERHQNNSIKAVTAYARFLDPGTDFWQINRKEQLLSFLNTKIKSVEDDPDKKWINSWNDYLRRLKNFFRWLHNARSENNDSEEISSSDWVTPAFARIREKKSKRLSPYSENEIWDRDELLTIIKYEPFKRNKAAISLCWDLNARNHEITLLKIKHIRLRERYGEGEIPYQSKTGTGPALLTFSFPYVRDWLNEHPFRNEPEARLICNLITGGPVKPEAMWTMMRQLRARIIRLLENNCIIDKLELEKLTLLIKRKKWNPYCIRHSAITADSDFLPEYALKKKVRWCMNSKQGARYIKRRMGNDLKQRILVQNGIIPEDEIKNRPAVLTCGRCGVINAHIGYCSKCSYPLTSEAFDEIKKAEEMKFRVLQDKYEKNMKAMREEMECKFQQILAKIDIATLK